MSLCFLLTLLLLLCGHRCGIATVFTVARVGCGRAARGGQHWLSVSWWLSHGESWLSHDHRDPGPSAFLPSSTDHPCADRQCFPKDAGRRLLVQYLRAWTRAPQPHPSSQGANLCSGWRPLRCPHSHTERCWFLPQSETPQSSAASSGCSPAGETVTRLGGVSLH